MDFAITLDSQSQTPLHKQLYDEIRQAILSGRLRPGRRIPSTRQLAQSLGISRATATMSYDLLLSEGYLQSHTGSGTYVCRQLPDDLLRAGRNKDASKAQTASASRTRGAVKKLSRYGNNLATKPWLPFGGPEPEIQFSFGRPDMAEFPMRIWQQLTSNRLRANNLSELDCPSQAQGYLPLRQAIASYLGRSRAVNCTSGEVVIVNGSQQAIDLVTRCIIDRGDRVGIEDPGYLGAKKAFEAQGAELVSVPVDNSGVMVENLRGVTDLKLVYVTPSHQSPTGSVLALPRRLELLDWAAKSGTYIVEDDYDSEFRYSGRPIPALSGLDHEESVIYIGTFSKVLFPGLRLGYLVLPPALVPVFSRAKWLCDRHTPVLAQQVLADFIAGGHLDRHIRRMRSLYEKRRRIVTEALKQVLGDTVTICGDNAGINVFIRLATRASDDAIMASASAGGIGLMSARHSYSSSARPGEFVLNYGGLSDELIHEGVQRLGQAVKQAEAASDTSRQTPAPGPEEPSQSLGLAAAPGQIVSATSTKGLI